MQKIRGRGRIGQWSQALPLQACAEAIPDWAGIPARVQAGTLDLPLNLENWPGPMYPVLGHRVCSVLG